jgi:hypothetical protein
MKDEDGLFFLFFFFGTARDGHFLILVFITKEKKQRKKDGTLISCESFVNHLIRVVILVGLMCFLYKKLKI